MHKTTRSYRQWQEEQEDCEQCKEVWLDVVAALCKGWGRQNNSGPPKMSLPHSMNAEYVTLDFKKKWIWQMLLNRDLERGTRSIQGPWAGRLGEEVTLKESERKTRKPHSRPSTGNALGGNLDVITV